MLRSRKEQEDALVLSHGVFFFVSMWVYSLVRE